MITVDWMTEGAGIDAMAARWDALAEATDPDSAFLQSGWFAAAWKWCMAKSSLAVLRVWRGPQLIGLLPMKREIERARWPWMHTLRSLDVPDTQQFSLLSESGLESQVAATVVAELQRIGADLDLVQLRKLHSTRANIELLAQLRAIARSKIAVVDLCPCVKLDESWASYYGTRSRRLKKGNNLLANNLKKSFRDVSVKREALDNSERGRELLQDVLALSEQSWKQNLENALHQPFVRDWFDELRRLGDAGALVVWTLRLDGLLVAAEIQIDFRGHVAALRADINEAFDKYGVGSYLNWKVAESLLGSGRKIYNMGPGYSAYKQRWANLILESHVATLYGSGPAGRVGWLRDHHVVAIRSRATALLRGSRHR